MDEQDPYIDGGSDYDLDDYKVALVALVNDGPYADGRIAREMAHQVACMVDRDTTIAEAFLVVSADLAVAATRVGAIEARREREINGR